MDHLKDQLSSFLTLAEKAVRKAGCSVAQSAVSSRTVEIDSRRDVKIRADRESEGIIVDTLRSDSDFSILTEESGLLTGLDGAQWPTWIVDPLDGSVNFSRDLPICCVSVGLWWQTKPILGAIYDFNRDELFSGIVGEGAWLNGQDIWVSTVDSVHQAVACMGFPVNTSYEMGKLSAFVQRVRAFKKVRLLGSASLSLAYVACGRADAYMERDIMFWDVAAGIAILVGAGGNYSIEQGNREYALEVYAGNGLLNSNVVA